MNDRRVVQSARHWAIARMTIAAQLSGASPRWTQKVFSPIHRQETAHPPSSPTLAPRERQCFAVADAHG